MDGEGSVESTVLAVEEAARRRSKPVRSRSALRRLVRSIREEGREPTLRAAGPNMVAVDFVPLEIAVSRDGRRVLPLVALVLHPSSGSVLAARIEFDPPNAKGAAAALLTWLDGLRSSLDGSTVDLALIPADGGDDWTQLFRILGRHRIHREGASARRVPAGGIVLNSLGREVLGLPTRPRMTHRPWDERRPVVRSTDRNVPLDAEQAQMVLDERLAGQVAPDLHVQDRFALVAALRDFVSAHR